MKKGNSLLKTAINSVLLIVAIVVAIEIASFAFLYINNRNVDIKEGLQRTLITDARLHDVPVHERSLKYMRQQMLHPYLGYVRNPRIVSHRFNDVTIDEPVNDFGFFGPDPLTKNTQEKFIIAITGGSVALEFYLYARQYLEEELRKAGILKDQEIIFVPLALGGMKQPQQLAALGYLLALGAEYDLVLNVDGFNEIALPFSENRRYGVNPFYPRGWNLYSTKSIDAQTAMFMGEMSNIKQDLANWGRRLSHFPMRESYTVLAFWQQYLRRMMEKGQAVEGMLRDHMKQKRQLTAQEAGPEYDYGDGAGFLADLAEVWANASRMMWALCKANDIAYLHFLQPNQYVPDSHDMTPWERNNAFIGKGYLYGEGANKGYKYLERAGSSLKASGLPFVDLTMIFHDEERTVYKDSCCHYNQLGNDIMARHVSGEIARLFDVSSNN